MIRRSSWDSAHCHSPGYLSGRTVCFSSASSSPASTLPLSSLSRSSWSSSSLSSLCSLCSGEFRSWGATGLRQLRLSRRRRLCHKVWNPPIFWTSWCLTIKSSLISYHLFYIHLLFFSFFWFDICYIFFMRSPDVKFRDVSSDYGKLELSWWVFLSDKIIIIITTSITIVTIIIFSRLGMWTQMRTSGTSESSFLTVQELCWSKILAMPTGDHSHHDIIFIGQITYHDISILASQNRISG